MEAIVQDCTIYCPKLANKEKSFIIYLPKRGSNYHNDQILHFDQTADVYQRFLVNEDHAGVATAVKRNIKRKLLDDLMKISRF